MTDLEQVFARLDEWIRERMQAFRTPGLVLALVDREGVVHQATYGLTNIDTAVPVTAETMFAIGSVGKSFAGIAAVQAAEAGLVDLHAPVTNYLPWFQVQSRHGPITLHHLLTHSAGIIRGTDFSPDARGEVWALRETEVGFAPGERFSYSDVGYKIVGLVLEAAMRQPYGAILRQQILDPLGMSATASAITHELRPRMAQGYRPLYDDRPTHRGQPLVPAAWTETNSADGSLVSTIGDMATYARMLLQRGQGPRCPILTEAAYALFAGRQVEQGDGWHYGYGLDVFEQAGFAHIGHGGDMPGYEAYLWLDIDNGLGVVVLATQPYPTRVPFAALGQFRAARIGAELPPLPAPPDPARSASAPAYAGTYRSGEQEATFVAEDEQLFLLSGGEKLPVEWHDEHRGLIDHPAWDRFPLRFEAMDDQAEGIVELVHGPNWYTTSQDRGEREASYPAEWDRFTGHYRAHNPWESNFRVVARQGQLLLVTPGGDEENLTPLDNGAFCVGDPTASPERLRFDQIANDQALRATRNTSAYYRFFTP